MCDVSKRRVRKSKNSVRGKFTTTGGGILSQRPLIHEILAAGKNRRDVQPGGHTNSFSQFGTERKDLRIKGNLEYAYGTACCDLSDFLPVFGKSRRRYRRCDG
jgi:hypothetical protein